MATTYHTVGATDFQLEHTSSTMLVDVLLIILASTSDAGVISFLLSRASAVGSTALTPTRMDTSSAAAAVSAWDTVGATTGGLLLQTYHYTTTNNPVLIGFPVAASPRVRGTESPANRLKFVDGTNGIATAFWSET